MTPIKLVSKYTNYLSWIYNWKCRLQNISSGLDVLNWNPRLHLIHTADFDHIGRAARPPQLLCFCPYTLQWRHNERDGVSNHQPHECLLKRLFRRRSNKTSKLPFTGLCEGNLPATGEFPAQRASNAENVSIWWRHHELYHCEKTNPPIIDKTDGLSTSRPLSSTVCSTHLPLAKMAAISQTIFSDAFSWTKSSIFD